MSAFKEFCTGVVQHMLDRNPDTLKASMTVMFRDELAEPVIEKLQREKQLPGTELDILKMVTDAQDCHSMNEVKVESVKPLGPLEKDVVPLLVTGKTVTKVKGKPDRTHPFAIRLSCKMNDQTGGYPQVIDAAFGSPGELASGKGIRARVRKGHKYHR